MTEFFLKIIFFHDFQYKCLPTVYSNLGIQSPINHPNEQEASTSTCDSTSLNAKFENFNRQDKATVSLPSSFNPNQPDVGMECCVFQCSAILTAPDRITVSFSTSLFDRPEKLPSDQPLLSLVDPSGPDPRPLSPYEQLPVSYRLNKFEQNCNAGTRLLRMRLLAERKCMTEIIVDSA